MNFSTIKFKTLQSAISLITLNRPERLNAINLDMLEELHVLFGQLNNDENVRVTIITGEGRGFCSGADLLDKRLTKEATALFSSSAAHLMKIQKVYSRLIIEMRRLAQPIIAAVNGPAAGGGMCVALASDVIIAGPKASFTPSFINIGLSGGELGSSYFLPRVVGSARAADILLTGRTVDAKEAEKIGLVSRLVPEDRLMDTAYGNSRRYARKNGPGSASYQRNAQSKPERPLTGSRRRAGKPQPEHSVCNARIF
jgi:enoyl-CoA hydratase